MSSERLVADQAVLRDPPAAPFEPCHKCATKVSSLSLVRYRLNDYSVPTAYGFRDVLVKGFVDWVVIFCGAVEIAWHRRSYERGQFVFEPRPFLFPVRRHDRVKPRGRTAAPSAAGGFL
jgi:hypothetical protein